MYKRSSGGSFTYKRSYHHIYRNKSFENLNDVNIHNINNSYSNILANSESNKPYSNSVYSGKCIQDLEFSSDHDYEWDLTKDMQILDYYQGQDYLFTSEMYYLAGLEKKGDVLKLVVL